MRIDIDRYSHFKPLALKYYKEHDLRRAEEMAVVSFIPLIALFVFLQEEYGGFEENIESLTEFYGYDEIVREKK